MCGQAVEKDGPRGGPTHQGLVDLVAREGVFPLTPLMLLAHRDPDVGAHGVGAGHGLGRIVRRGDGHAVTPGSVHGDGVQLVAGRAGQPDIDPGQCAGQRQAAGHVVAVADPGQGATGQVAPALLEGEQVGEGLAGVGRSDRRLTIGTSSTLAMASRTAWSKTRAPTTRW